MQLIHNEKQYREWFMREFLYNPEDTSSQLIDEDEWTRFIDQHQPEGYPCVAFMNHTVPLADSPHVVFIYKKQLVEWLNKM